MQPDASTLGLLIRKVQAMPPDQKKTILETDAKIKLWLSAHPGEEVTAEKVPTILATKLETPKAELEKMFEPAPIQANPLQNEAAKIMETNGDFGLAESKKEFEQKISSVQATQPKAPEIAHSMAADAELAKQVEGAFENEVNDIYGKKGLFGSTRGIETKEWKFMANLSATKVISYYQADSSSSTLDPSMAQELTNSTQHQTFLKQLDSLIKESKGRIKPYENETVEQFLRRLGHFVMREHLESQMLANSKQ